jgi:hypothetical protein
MASNKPSRLPETRDGFVIPVWNGLLEHCSKMGEAVWYFLWCLDRTTKEETSEIGSDAVGRVLGTMPCSDSDVAIALGVSKWTVRRWRLQLTEQGYITVTRTPIGYSIQVKNSKKFSKKRAKSVATGSGAEMPTPGANMPTHLPSETEVNWRNTNSELADQQLRIAESATLYRLNSDPTEIKQATTPEKPGAVGWLQKCYGQIKEQVLPVSKDQRTQLEALAERDGLEVFQKTCRQWIETRPLAGLEQVTNKLIEEYDAQQAVACAKQTANSFELSEAETERIIAQSSSKQQKWAAERSAAIRAEEMRAAATADQIGC